jgi:tRNA threonylcarbamoyladenosine biosynthesis protein TsaE
VAPPTCPLKLPLEDELATLKAGFSLGEALIALAVKALFIGLTGDLGAGKTTFCQGVGKALGLAAGEVTSPTFALAHEHQGLVAFSHLDLYRLGDRPENEFLEAGLTDYLDGITLVEWPERLPDSFWPLNRLNLTLTIAPQGRLLVGLGLTPEAQKVWAHLTQRFLLG